ncbi:hypothetical protein AGOR_G00153410 [Albula goreensis]|uniref:MKRN2 opposite strand protein-like C-terminal domain-containing protein n=1 Tax=Albula goreensis TaxID=1534307 RepID=A0A8T3D6V6_9TELE|nr:hypothetical protein AGOR_G00153410 [Albula goreensis]
MCLSDSTSLMDRTVIKFSHCDKDIYCFSDYNVCWEPSVHAFTADCRESKSRLSRCPLCFQPLKFNLLEAPVSIPCPFTNGHNSPYAFNIGSMCGPLHISEYDDSELHIGITNSKGVVYNYTLTGVRRDECGWEQCVSLQLAPSGWSSLSDQWDAELEHFSSMALWAPQRFHEEREFGSRCYAFALTFINHMRTKAGKPCLTRDEFTGNYVLPRIKITSKYVRVYQEISHNGFYVPDKHRHEML